MGKEVYVNTFGVARIIDGFFIGDHLIAKQLQFMRKHEVTHIVNCAGHQIPNFF